MTTKVIKKITKKNHDELLKKLDRWYVNWDLGYYFTSGIETEDGKICLLDKPDNIRTIFHFPEGMTHTINETSKMAEKVKQNRDYFISENIKSAGYAYELKMIRAAEKGLVSPVIVCLGGCDEEGKGRASMEFFENDTPLYDFHTSNKMEEKMTRYATDEELQAYKQAVIAAVDNLTKRLNTYLKRYGLSKIKAQTFWDER